MGKETCVGAGLLRIGDSSSPHHIGIVDVIHSAHQFALASDRIRPFLYHPHRSIISALPVACDKADTGLKTESDIQAYVRLVIVGKRSALTFLKQLHRPVHIF